MSRFAIVGLSVVLLVSQAPAAPEFLRGVNLAGPAVTLGGRQWDGDGAVNFECRDKELVMKQRLKLKPGADTGQMTMLHSFRWSSNTRLAFTDLPDGVYTVWLHIVEDNNSETFDIMVEGMPAVRRFVSGPEGTWKRVGPMVAEVRMDWCVQPFDKANHAPVAVCNGQKGVGTVFVDAKPGDTVLLSADGSEDPDGDALRFRRWVYREAGTYKADVPLRRADFIRGALVVPGDAAGKAIHVIQEVTDEGAPSLTSYRRLVVRVR